MSARARPVAAMVAAILVAGGGAGCSSSASYPYPLDVVWRLAMAQAVAWKPESIDEDAHQVTSTKSNLAGAEIVRELKVRTDRTPRVPPSSHPARAAPGRLPVPTM